MQTTQEVLNVNIGIAIAILGLALNLVIKGAALRTNKDTAQLGNMAWYLGLVLGIGGAFWGAFASWDVLEVRSLFIPLVFLMVFGWAAYRTRSKKK